MQQNRLSDVKKSPNNIRSPLFESKGLKKVNNLFKINQCLIL